ncbi:unnamed protein product [Polarella glacialis]|uniref:Uncharacterized protein n=1 Tax=Polarella glacialis TaxID=89957 RepID=A0A813D8I6_POLGL|nr:unnamed protein product [Polarella glacialis]
MHRQGRIRRWTVLTWALASSLLNCQVFSPRHSQVNFVTVRRWYHEQQAGLLDRDHFRGLSNIAARSTRRATMRTAQPTPDSFDPPPPRQGDYTDMFCRGTNAFFGQLVIPQIRELVKLQPAGTAGSNLLDKLTAAPETPGISRPLWVVMAGSIPTALIWYGYYKFSVEEELFQAELRKEGRVTGCGGYGTLFPFVFAILLGLMAQLLGFEDVGAFLIAVGSVWILLGQINLYRRVNEIVQEHPSISEGEPVLWEWWGLLPPPLDVIVGVRQVHFLAKVSAAEREEAWEKDVVAEELFPFISTRRFTLKELVRSPRLWFWFCKDVEDFDVPFLRD